MYLVVQKQIVFKLCHYRMKLTLHEILSILANKLNHDFEIWSFNFF